MNKRIVRLLVLIIVLALLLAPVPVASPTGTALASDQRAPAADLVVNNTYDETGSCPEFCSLRQAILEANANEGPDTITFDIPTDDPGYNRETGQWTLTLGSPLPTLSNSDPLMIDATPLGPGDCSAYFVIDATNVPYGKEITGANKTFSGLVIKNAQVHGLYIHGSGAQNNQLMCSYVVSNTVDGVRIGGGATGNTIGSTTASEPNVISYNGGDGVHITYPGTSNNTVVHNHIGTDLAGTSAWANGGYGVRMSNGAATNTIGLAGTGGRNLISGNTEGGVLISQDTSRNNVVRNNYIGTNVSGTAAVANQDGVVVSDAPGNTIGPDNLISGNERDGVRVEGGTATGNVVKGNLIGTNASGNGKVSNQRFGVLLQTESSSSTVGGDSAADTNVISGNGYQGDYPVYGGVGILGSNSNLLCNNKIGTMASSTSALPNAGHGVMLTDYAQENTIGQGLLVNCANTVAWNEGDGIYIYGEGTVHNTIGRNSIHDNEGLGINNEAGGNEELGPPAISQYSVLPVGQVTLEASACPGCTVLVYSDDDGEGRYYEGSGTAHATSGHFDWSGTPYHSAFTLVAIDAYSNTSEFSAALAKLTLSVDDALPNVWVNKVVGDATSPANQTIVEVVAQVVSWDPSLEDDVDVIVTIPGDLFGNPVRVFVRDQVGDYDGTTTSWTDLGGGKYRADDVDLLAVGSTFQRRVVFRFHIPNSTLPQQVQVQGEIQVPGRTIHEPYATGTIRIIKPGNVRSIIVANRSLLYDNYTDADVTSLLNRLYTEAQGSPASHTPLATIYYVDAYSTTVRNWDNTVVNYTSEATANTVANAIDDLVEDWHDDATLYLDIFGLHLPIGWPGYLLIVGDDDTMPFYRYNDPSNDEGINKMSGCPQGWCVDSATNPAIHATDEDYFFTDNPYANIWGSTDWQKGDIELWVGRLLGDSAADMLSLLEEGVSWDNGKRGDVVMASVDGWELGLESDPGGSGHIADLYDVPALFRGKGFQVRNDDVPTTEVRTIDVMKPFEGGDASWNTNFRNAANNTGGMDLFFIGGHDSYNGAVLPGGNFSPNDTCAAGTCDYNRFDDDHSIAMIVGCHGGLPVPNVGGLGGVNDDMVYDLVHEGASAYIGATGFSYGSPNNLHRCTWGERLMQRFFSQLLKPPGINSMTIGSALARAKRDYVFGYGKDDALDRKTVTEYNVYGVPWNFIYYASGGTTAQAAAGPEERAFATLSGPVAPAAEAGVYSRNFVVDVAAYTAGTETQDGIVYDLLSIEGGNLAIADGAPVLPYVEGYILTLPFDSTVTEVQVVDVGSSDIGTHNVPIAQVSPWSEGGLTYTTTTDIEDPYPTDLVQWQETSEGLLFTLFPIQHNPTTDETTFYNHFEVQVTYEAPLTIGVTDFSIDKTSYSPGEAVNTSAIIGNVGDAGATLTAILTIEDEFGGVIGSQTSEEFTVPAGGSHELSLAWAGTPDQGSYRAAVTISSNGDTVGGASAGFQVVVGPQHEVFLPLIRRSHP